MTEENKIDLLQIGRDSNNWRKRDRKWKLNDLRCVMYVCQISTNECRHICCKDELVTTTVMKMGKGLPEVRQLPVLLKMNVNVCTVKIRQQILKEKLLKEAFFSKARC